MASLLLLPPVLPFAAADHEGPYHVESIDGALLPLSPFASTVFLSDDTVTSAFSLGFTSRFFGRSTSEFWIGSNGFVTLHFLTPDGCCDGQPIPSPGGPDGMIAAWWTDLDPSAGGTVRFDRTTLENQSALIVDYRNVSVVGTNDTASFQVVFLRNGVFEIRIAHAAAASTRQVSVGAEDRIGSAGIELLRQTGGSVDNVGFRFVPNVQPTPPPTISAVTPSNVTMGSFARVLGSNFTDGSVVLVDSFSAPTFFESDSSLAFFVPFIGPGLRDVSVENPDGNRTTLPGALLILEPFALHGASASSTFQGDMLTVFGSAFDERTTLLLDETIVEPLHRSRTQFGVRVPVDLRPGLYDITAHHPFEGARTLRDALVVLGRPDHAITGIEASRAQVGLAAAPIEHPGPWRIDVQVANLGDARAEDVMLELLMRPAGATPGLAWTEQGEARHRPTLLKGERWSETFFLGDAFDVGDMEFLALVRSNGVADRDPSNDAASTTDSALYTGLGGGNASPCLIAPNACRGPERREHTMTDRDQTDTHHQASFVLDARMAFPDFTFDDFPIVFTRVTPLGGGGFEECTTWRFLGAGGMFRVTMRAPDGISGGAFVAFADASESAGTQRTSRWSDVRAFGVILAESERETLGEGPAEPLFEYVYGEDPAFSWELTAEGLSGDFTHCASRPSTGSGHDDFFFHALPADVNEQRASFSGAGHADRLSVRAVGATGESTSAPLL